MKPRILTLALACSLLLGCKPAPLSVSPISTGALPAPTGSSALPADAQQKTGTLVLSVKWPERSYAGFNAQAIPLSTNALVVDITDDQGKNVAHEVLKRTSGTLQTTKEMVLSVGTGYNVNVKAYAATAPTDQDEVIAFANATDVAVKWNEVAPLKLSLSPLFAPVVTDISATNAGAGATLELTGSNFTRGGGSPSVIFPSGTTVTGTMVDGKLRVTVPAGAGSGNLQVKVDGIPSASLVAFNELTQLSLTASGSTDSWTRLESDGVIHTWIGDRFQLSPLATDSTGAPFEDPTILNWSNASGSVGTLGATGSYQVAATQLTTGTYDQVTARSGNVSATRQILVAPPAGPLLDPHPELETMPGSVPYDPTDVPGSGDGISIAKLANGMYVIAWVLDGHANIEWRILNQDGTPASPVKRIVSYRKLTETQPLVAAKGNEAVIMIRNSNVLTELDAYQITVGDTITTTAYRVVDTTWDVMDATDLGCNVYMGNLASNGSNYMLGYYVSKNDGYHYKTRNFYKDPDSGNLSLKTVDATSYIRDSQVNGVLRTFASDRASLTTDGANYYLRFYYDAAGVGKYFWTWFHPDGSQDSSAQDTELSEPERFASDATSGNTHLFASIDYKNSNNTAVFAMVDKDWNPIKGRTVISNLEGAVTDPFDYPVTAVWDGTEYLVCFSRIQTINGQPTPQPMIQAISETGTFIGKAYPIAAAGSKATIARLDGEGAICTWLDPNNQLRVRKLKYH
ncbi:MAG TPA: IPT/TIG domain-containing protein [Stenomitos sp.]